MSEERAAPRPEDDDIAARDQSPDVTRATANIMLYGLMPAWIVPGLLDWWYHRRTKIERTSGARESLLHAAMMATIGGPVTLGLLLEVNAGVLATMIAGVAVHEGLTLWDVAYAASLRDVPPNEQHCHSFLEVLPVSALAFMLALHWEQAAALAGRGPEAPRFRPRWKRKPLPLAYLAGILSAIALFVGVPYTEELVRCYRADPTFAPHHNDG